MRLAGIDGCKDKWLVAESNEDLSSLTFSIVESLDALFDRAKSGSLYIAIDIPIGLAEYDSRQCDNEARKVLCPRHKCSIFPAPIRDVLNYGKDEYRIACDSSKTKCGRGISKQSFGIAGKIKSVDSLMSPELQEYVLEVHPEVTFCTISGSCMRHSKKSSEGLNERLDVLAANHLRFQPEAVKQQYSLHQAALDDIVDAAACLLTAQQILQGTAVQFPALHNQQRDSKGLLMAITACTPTIYSRVHNRTKERT